MEEPRPRFVYHVPLGRPDAPVLVILPGVNSGPYLFEPARATLGQSHRLLILNPPDGSQFAFSVTKPLTVKRYAEMALEIMQDVIPGYPAVPVALMGHSLGGYAAQELARLLPVPPLRLVLVSTSRGQPDTAYDMDSMARALGKSFWQFSKDVEADPIRFFEPVFGPGYAVRNRTAYEAFVRDMRAKLPPKSATMAQLMAGSAFSSVGWIGKLLTPALVIHGSADLIVSAASGRKLAKSLPLGRYLEFYNVGHFPMLEHPGFYPAVQRFLLGHGEGDVLEKDLRGFWGKLYHRFFKLHG